jgi:glutathione peroxidase
LDAEIYSIAVNKITGEPASLGEFKGRVLLVVNVASKCGFTPQYEGLEKAYKQYRDRGLVVAGFPANDFSAQEPGDNEEIRAFCTTNFGVEFPMYEKITVVGEDKHPLYAALIAAKPHAVNLEGDTLRRHLVEFGATPNDDPEVLWNFEKFLVSRSGEVVERFSPDTAPDAPVIIAAIEAELLKS